MRVLGIDPGMRITGYGCVELTPTRLAPRLLEAGTLTFPRADPIEDRLGRMYDSLRGLIGELRPDRLVVEKLYAHYRHPRTAILMAHARGVILLAAHQSDCPLLHMPATEVKKAMTGHGHASKLQVQQAVAARCGLERPPSPPDVADAIALALCAAERRPEPGPASAPAPAATRPNRC